MQSRSTLSHSIYSNDDKDASSRTIVSLIMF